MPEDDMSALVQEKKKWRCGTFVPKRCLSNVLEICMVM